MIKYWIFHWMVHDNTKRYSKKKEKEKMFGNIKYKWNEIFATETWNWYS